MTSGNELYDKPEKSQPRESPYTGFGATSRNHPVFHSEAFGVLDGNDDPDNVYTYIS